MSAQASFLISERALLVRVLLAVLAVNLLMVTMVVFVLAQIQSRDDAQRAALAQSTASILAANLSGIIARVDGALHSVTDEAERQSAAGGVNKAALDQFIIRTHERLPEVATFRAANSEGLAIYGAEVTVANTKSLAHRDYYQYLRDNRAKQLIFSQPLVGGITGKWMILFVRRIDQADGSFGGLAYAGVTLEYLTTAFSSFNTGQRGSISLRGGDLALIDRFPAEGDPAKMVGRKDASPELQDRVSGGVKGGTLGGSDVTSFQKCGPYPFYVEVKLDARDFIETRTALELALALAALFVLFTTSLLAAVYLRNARRTRAAAASLLQRDEQIQGLLQEKEIILNEVHHRIKNNMATIAGLLTIQSSLGEAAPPEEILKTASSRVRSMAVLYEKLFLSTNKQEVSLKDYFSALLPEIHENFPGAQLVQLQMTLDDAILPARTASTLGILLNELMTNSMKHAFPLQSPGKIEVSVTLSGGQVLLKYRDDGVGLVEGEPMRQGSGFGMRLIEMMVRQLKATMVRLPGPGTGWSLQFPP